MDKQIILALLVAMVAIHTAGGQELPQCSGGQVFAECHSACPLTCDTLSSPPLCTKQCVPRCGCPHGKVLRSGVCIDPTSC